MNGGKWDGNLLRGVLSEGGVLDVWDVVDVLDVLEVLDVWDVGDVWDPSYDGAGVRDVLQFSTSTLILFLRKY